jgi:hypothetical protein
LPLSSWSNSRLIKRPARSSQPAELCPADGGSTFLWNIDELLQNYAVLQLRRQYSATCPFRRGDQVLHPYKITEVCLCMFRWVLRSTSELQSSAAHRLLPHSSVCALHPHSGAVVGLLLDTSRGYKRQSWSW